MLLSELVKQLSGELSSINRVRTMKAYATVMRSAISFSKEDMHLGEVFNPQWLFEYQCFLYQRRLKRNTISFYMRMLRSMYNKAVDMGMYVNVPRLFLKVFTGLDATIKRSVSPEMILRIAKAPLNGTLEFCRDIFMLCFYLQGMTFVDLAYLKRSDYQGDSIIYRRKKTNSQITVAVRAEAKKILDKYMDRGGATDYLFPIITNPDKDDRLQYQSALRAQNRNLKRLAEVLGIDETLSSYVARHSWATMAYHNKVPTALISEAMGHKTEEITRIYLSSFGLEKLSEANDIVVRALKRSGEGKKNVRHLTSDRQDSGTNIETNFEIRNT